MFTEKRMCAALVIACAWGAATLPAVAGIRAGFARVDITPPTGAYIPGYYHERIAIGANTPLVAECLAFSDDKHLAVVFSVDNLHLTRKTIDAVKERMKAEYWIPPELVFIHSTHTHQGAATDTSYYTGIKDARVRQICDEYGEALVVKMLLAGERAMADMKPAQFRLSRGEVRPGISFIRRYLMKDGSVNTNPDRAHPERVARMLGEPDNSVQVVRIVREGAPDIALVNFQTHADAVGGLRYDADWPGVLRETFERALNDGTHLFFMCGAQGDANHFQVLGENPFWKSHVYSEYHVYMGRAIAGVALSIWDCGTPVAAKGGIAGVIAPTRVASNRPDAARVEAIRLYDAGRKDKIKGFGAMEILAMCDKNSNARKLMNGPDAFEMPVSALSIGGVVAFAGFPGEPFTEIGRKVKAGSPFPMTFVGCLVNDSFGYLPSSSASREGGYEVVTSRFGATCGDTLVRVQLENLSNLSNL